MEQETVWNQGAPDRCCHMSTPTAFKSPSTAHALVAVCREMDVRFSITIRQHARLRNLIEAIPETDWTPIPYWMDGTANVAKTTYRACLKSIQRNDYRHQTSLYLRKIADDQHNPLFTFTHTPNVVVGWDF